jgi:hypothetical protein
MHHPAHPGEILRELYLKPMGVSVGIAERMIFNHCSISSDGVGFQPNLVAPKCRFES